MNSQNSSSKSRIVRNLKIGEGLPKICVPLVAEDKKALERQLSQMAAVPCDLVEWRADFYSGIENDRVLEDALALIRERVGEKPVIFTFRTGQEGGNRCISPEEYAYLNERAAASGLADIVDVEINRGEALALRLTKIIQEKGKLVLGSFHDFDQTPENAEMEKTLCRMQELGMDITKLAVMPKSRQDVLRLLELSVKMKEELSDRPFITMAMGTPGVITRAAGGFDGSAVTFGTAGTASAPGQIPADKLQMILQILSEGNEEK